MTDSQPAGTGPDAPAPGTPEPGVPRPGGAEPDPRYSYANERTFLAWSRTALALVVAGLGVVQLLPPFPGVPWGRHVLGMPLIVFGAVVALAAYREWVRNLRDRADGGHLRRRGPSVGAAVTTGPDEPAEGHPEGYDASLVRERTSLAWTRTALSFAAVGGVVLKREVVPGLVIMGLAVLVWRLGRLAHHLPGRLKLITAAIVLVAVAALVIALTSA